MYFKSTLILACFCIFSGFSQETETGSILQSDQPYLKYDASQIQINEELQKYFSNRYNDIYDLKKIAPGLFLQPESFTLNSPALKRYSAGYTLKYYLADSDLYLLGGMQTNVSTPIDSGRSFNVGLNAGIGYDVSANTQIEGRSFYSLYNSAPDDAFQPVQLIPMQPLSLGIKTKF